MLVAWVNHKNAAIAAPATNGRHEQDSAGNGITRIWKKA